MLWRQVFHSNYFILMLNIILTRPVLDRFHDSSTVVLLICLNLHSVLKAEKVCESMRKCAKSYKYAESMRKCANCYFCSTNAIFFAVQIIFFWCAVQIFWCAGKKNLSLQYKLLSRVLPPYVIFLKGSTKVCCIFLGCVCKRLSMDGLLLSKIRTTLFTSAF